jgi:hypothetical protein
VAVAVADDVSIPGNGGFISLTNTINGPAGYRWRRGGHGHLNASIIAGIPFGPFDSFSFNYGLELRPMLT